MATFTEHFSLGKSQAELDFVDIPIDSDIPLFVDPYAISQRPDTWSHTCHRTITSFFQNLLDCIRAGHNNQAFQLLRFLREPNETHFGFSRGRPQGAGVGGFQANQILQALSASEAFRTGFISSLGECELMIDGIGRDKISDLATNLIRAHLAEYTLSQCELWNIPVQQVALPPFYDAETAAWNTTYFNLPIANNGPVLLVPKVIARYDIAHDHNDYYNNFVVEYLQAEHLNAGFSLVTTLKSGRRRVYKKDIKAAYPKTKQRLYEFSRAHPEILDTYKEHLERVEKEGLSAQVSSEDEGIIAEALIEALVSIPPGNNSANDYHNLIIGILEFLFFPGLLCPIKEQEIHQGRKRIDIVMENGASEGVLHRLHAIRHLPCSFVPIECKNYGREVANPELDQLAGRFSPNRGKFGILSCRVFQDRALFIERCRDTLGDDRGLIVPLDDETIIRMLGYVSAGQRAVIDTELNRLINEVWIS